MTAILSAMPTLIFALLLLPTKISNILRQPSMAISHFCAHIVGQKAFQRGNNGSQRYQHPPDSDFPWLFCPLPTRAFTVAYEYVELQMQ